MSSWQRDRGHPNGYIVHFPQGKSTVISEIYRIVQKIFLPAFGVSFRNPEKETMTTSPNPQRLERLEEQLDHLVAEQLKVSRGAAELRKQINVLTEELAAQWDCLQALRQRLNEDEDDEVS